MFRRSLSALLGVCLSSAVWANCAPEGRGHLSIIIDDLGYHLERGQAIARLPAPITLAIIPGTPHARHLAELGHSRGKELMVHLPMSSAHTVVADPLALTDSLTHEAFNTILDEAMNAVPGAVGVNNHMGSALTVNRPAMEQLMGYLKERDLYFIDSRTTADTVAVEVARDMALKAASRSVFLDNERDRRLIREHLQRAIDIAANTGSAIAIGHPYPETVEVLSEALPRLPELVTLTPASSIARCQSGQSGQSLTSIP